MPIDETQYRMLLDAKIEMVLSELRGSRETTAANFETIKVELKQVNGLVQRMNSVEQKNIDLESQLADLQRSRIYRSTTLPPIFLGCISLIMSIAAIVIN